MAHKYKTGLTESDLNLVRRDGWLDAISLLKNAKAQASFKEGDVLVAEEHDGDGKWIPVNMRAGNVPHKYFVVYKDENDLVYAKKINANCQLSKRAELICMSGYRFSLDPSLAESIILDDENAYDPNSGAKLLRKHKQEARKYNETIEVKFDNHKAVQTWVKTLKKGDVFWTMSGPSDRSPMKCKVKRKRHFDVDKTITGGGGGWGNLNDSYYNDKYNVAGLDKYSVVHVDQSYDDYKDDGEWETNDFVENNIYSKKPKTYDMEVK